MMRVARRIELRRSAAPPPGGGAVRRRAACAARSWLALRSRPAARAAQRVRAAAADAARAAGDASSSTRRPRRADPRQRRGRGVRERGGAPRRPPLAPCSAAFSGGIALGSLQARRALRSRAGRRTRARPRWSTWREDVGEQRRRRARRGRAPSDCMIASRERWVPLASACSRPGTPRRCRC